ncbi:unnamed protein product [Gulo gulo]|uniref:Uncharacterized protein n=1 Tax=Gulo gulo TaxID=48420 RepID=A0A9X9LI33_GULGU|nr:unnamed protein product [Gulo gulo]
MIPAFRACRDTGVTAKVTRNLQLQGVQREATFYMENSDLERKNVDLKQPPFNVSIPEDAVNGKPILKRKCIFKMKKKFEEDNRSEDSRSSVSAH